MPMTTDQKVLIIGGGLAGLVLAHACQKHAIPYELYERDVTYDVRSQGGSLMLHLAMSYLKKTVTYPNAFENFGEKVAVNRQDPNLMSFTFFDGITEEIIHRIHVNEPGMGYRINRRRFRDWLIEGLDKERIHFGKKFSHYESSEESVTVHFQDGTSVTGGILVGADGSLSSVCTQLVGGREKFNEITKTSHVLVYSIGAWFTDEEWEPLRKFSESTGLAAGKYKHDDSTTNVFFTINDTDLARKDGRHKEVIFNFSRYEESEHPTFESDKECLDFVKQWVNDSFEKDSVFPRIFSSKFDNAETRPMKITVRERASSTELMGTDKRVFVVGDAAHCMTMFRGEGGNHAMIDACVLGTELGRYYAGEKTLQEAHDNYFDEMVARGVEAVQVSHVASKQVHTNRKEMIKTLKDMERKFTQAAKSK